MGVRAGALRAIGVTVRAGGAAGTGVGAGAAGVVIVTVEGEEKNRGGS